MPPKKNEPSKKAIEKAKQKIFEDKTFGLKNKNKSKQVQKQIQNIQRATMGQPKKSRTLDTAEAKKQRRLEEQARIRELEAIFKPVKKKEPEPSVLQQQQQQQQQQQPQEEVITAESIDQDESLLTIEDIIEKERQLIKDGTPVTFETFTKWKAFKKEQRERKERELLEQQLESFKKSGRGISGINLFKHDASLFVDDAEAANKDDYEVQGDLAEMEVDEGLFDAELDNIEAGVQNMSLVYDPATWKESQTPKDKLLTYLSKNKLPAAKFEAIQTGESDKHVVKCILPHANNMEFTPSGIFPNKKIAEHNAALLAMDWIESQDRAQQDGNNNNNNA